LTMSDIPPLEEETESKTSKSTSSFLDEGFPYKIRFGTAGLLGERRLKSKDVEVRAKPGLKDPKEGTVKPDAKLLDPEEDNCPELQAIWDKQQEVQRFVASRSVRSGLMPGVYVVRAGYFMEVRNKVKEGQKELAELVEKFIPVYEKAKERAKERLGAGYDESQYPSVDRIRKGIHIRARIVDIGLDEEKIKNRLGEEVLAEQLAELQADLKEAKAEIREALVSEFKKLLLRAQEIVKGTSDGKAKRFKDAAITNLKEFCKLFDAKDITDFQALRDLVKQTEAAIEGRDPDDIRGSKAIRDELAKAFAPIIAVLESEAVLRGTRKVVLD